MKKAKKWFRVRITEKATGDFWWCEAETATSKGTLGLVKRAHKSYPEGALEFFCEGEVILGEPKVDCCHSCGKPLNFAEALVCSVNHWDKTCTDCLEESHADSVLIETLRFVEQVAPLRG